MAIEVRVAVWLTEEEIRDLLEDIDIANDDYILTFADVSARDKLEAALEELENR